MRFKPASMAEESGLAAREIFELPDTAMAGERVGPALIALGLMAIGAVAPDARGLHVARRIRVRRIAGLGDVAGVPARSYRHRMGAVAKYVASRGKIAPRFGHRTQI
jgi:hypothetical protein